MKLIFFIFLSLSVYANEQFHIGVLFWSETIEGQVAMKQGLLNEADKINQNAEKKVQLTSFVAGDGEAPPPAGQCVAAQGFER